MRGWGIPSLGHRRGLPKPGGSGGPELLRLRTHPPPGLALVLPPPGPRRTESTPRRVVPSRGSPAPKAPRPLPVHQVLKKSHKKPTAAGWAQGAQECPQATRAIAAVWARRPRASPPKYREGRGRGEHRGREGCALLPFPLPLLVSIPSLSGRARGVGPTKITWMKRTPSAFGEKLGRPTARLRAAPPPARPWEWIGPGTQGGSPGRVRGGRRGGAPRPPSPEVG